MSISILPDEEFLSKVNLAGTHDSATAFAAMEKICRCQSLTIREQLEIGIRLLDIRLYCKKGEFFLVHSRADCYKDSEKTEKLTFDAVLSDCVEFLKKNPRETIVMSVKKDRGFFKKSFAESFYNKYIKNNDIWFTENRAPRLSECRGKIVLMRRYKYGDCGLDFSVWEDQGSDKNPVPLDVILNSKYKATVQDRYKLPPEAKWSVARAFLDAAEPTEHHIFVHFLSAAGVPVENAKIVNKFFKEYSMKSSPTGWIFLDFPTRELVEKINGRDDLR